MESMTAEIRQRMVSIQNRIEKAARLAGRDEGLVKLVVVTKAQPLHVVRAAIEAGARVLGENYPEETVPKIDALEQVLGVEWHMIGHLQSRKVALVAGRFDMLQSLDSLPLAEKLNTRLAELNRSMPVLLEMNVSGEESKFGFQASDEEHWDRLMDEIQQVMNLPYLNIRGLMTMPPLAEEAETSRPFFIRLRRLAERLAVQFGEEHFLELSMGTSTDFEVAVQEGATYVRIGTAIVGPRAVRL